MYFRDHRSARSKFGTLLAEDLFKMHRRDAFVKFVYRHPSKWDRIGRGPGSRL